MLINMQGVDGTAAEARVGGGRVFIKEGMTCRPRTCSSSRRVSKSNSERSESSRRSSITVDIDSNHVTFTVFTVFAIRPE